MRLRTSGTFGLATLALILFTGCGSRDYYTQTESGSHGAIAVKKVYYTPEQKEARDKALGYNATYTGPAPATKPATPADADLASIEERWSRLTPEQRASVVQSVKQMAGE